MRDTPLPERFGIPNSEGVGKLARRGASWTVLGLVGRQLLAIGSGAILARLVSPRDFGMIAMVTTCTGLLLLVADIGLTWGIVQARELDQVRLNTLFWLTLALGIVAWLGCVSVGPWLARFYEVSELAAITALMGVNPLLNNLAIVPMALLRRAIRQETISKIQLLSSACASAAAVLVAGIGWGWGALVLQQLLGCMLAFCAAWWCSGYRPGWPGSLSTVTPLIRFGGFSSLSNVVNYIQANVSTVAVGYFGGVAEAGFFSRALLLRNLPSQYTTVSFNDVMIPVLVALRGSPERMAAAYRKSLIALALVACPFAAWLGVASPEVVRLIYGPAWAETAPLLTWLSIAGVMLPVQATAVWLYIASGNSSKLFIHVMSMTPLLPLASLIGAYWGTQGIAAAVALTFAIPVTWVTMLLAHRAAAISFRESLYGLAPIFAGCILAVIAAALAAEACLHARLDWRTILFAKSLCGGSTYLAVLCALNSKLSIVHGMSLPLSRKSNASS
jgi:polysaccharide transporter, PST family